MKKSFVLLSTFASLCLSVSAFATPVLRVNRLPYQFRIPCNTTRSEVYSFGGRLYLSYYHEGEYGTETETETYILKGEAAHSIRTTKKIVLQPGWFAKCALVLDGDR